MQPEPDALGEEIMEIFGLPESLRERWRAIWLGVSPSFTCPRCGMTSHNPDDADQGYCGNCHDWVTPR